MCFLLFSHTKLQNKYSDQENHWKTLLLKNQLFEGLPWYPVVKISPSNAQGAGSIPGWGTKIPHALRPKKKHNTETIL